MLLVVCFSFCVQMAEGLHYGIVPYVCRPALGVVSGMIGAGGNAGAVIAGSIFFTGNFRLDQGTLAIELHVPRSKRIQVRCIAHIAALYEPQASSTWAS